MIVDTAKLRALAEAATPGPWTNRGYGFSDARGSIGFCHGFQDDATRGDGMANAAFIAAASPDVVIALLDEIDCGGKGCGTDESRACLRCCRIMLRNYEANHGTRCDAEQERLRRRGQETADQLADANAEIERMRGLLVGRAPRDANYAEADFEAVAENIAADPRWANRSDSQRVARWALRLCQQLAAMTAALLKACSMLDDAVQFRRDAREWFPEIDKLRKLALPDCTCESTYEPDSRCSVHGGRK